jgi:hypothetical protein
MEPGTFADFMDQLPTAFIRLFFIFLVLLIMTMAAFVLLRLRRATPGNTKPAQPKASGSGGGMAWFGNNNSPSPAAQAPTPNTSTKADDLPDIDTLLAMTAPDTPDAPPPEPSDSLRQPGLVNVRLTAGGMVDAAEMLVLLRDRDTNRLIVQIGEHAYNGAEADIDPEFRRRFVTLMKELSGIAPKLSKGAKAAPPPPKPEEDESNPPDTPQPVTLAGQIELHLQRRLTETGAFAGRSIHVKDAADGGVRIEVDGEAFESVGDVSDAEVKAFIAKVVADWQESQK